MIRRVDILRCNKICDYGLYLHCRRPPQQQHNYHRTVFSFVISQLVAVKQRIHQPQQLGVYMESGRGAIYVHIYSASGRRRAGISLRAHKRVPLELNIVIHEVFYGSFMSL